MHPGAASDRVHFGRRYRRGGYISIERTLAWFCKVCVGIYAFISGYGLFHSILPFKNKSGSLGQELKSIYASMMKRIFAFMSKYWLVFAIFIPLGVALGKLKIEIPLSLIENIFAYRYDYNDEWWYVKQYVFMVLLFPLIDLFFDYLFRKERRTVRVFFLLTGLGTFYILLFFVLFRLSLKAVIYSLIFIIGYLCARFDIFLKLQKRIRPGAPSGTVGLVVFAAAFALRSLLATDAAYCRSDIFIAPIVVFSLCLLTRKQGKVTGCLARLGKYSTYMWLTHTFYCYYYFREFSTFTHISTLIFIQLVVVSLLTAIVLSFLEKLISSTFLFVRRRITCHKLK